MFQAQLASHLKEYITEKMKDDAIWQRLSTITRFAFQITWVIILWQIYAQLREIALFRDCTTGPGEGELKIIDSIRQ